MTKSKRYQSGRLNIWKGVKTMTSLTYTANNREGQTWLVCPGKPDILLTDYIPDGTKVRGDEIEMKWQYYHPVHQKWYDDRDHKDDPECGFLTRQVATLRQKTGIVQIDPLYIDGYKIAFDWDYNNPMVVISKNKLFKEINKEQLQALKSWINKIEL